MLTTFIALVAATQETVTECIGAFKVKGVISGQNPSSAAQGEGDDGVQRARSGQERGRGAGVQDEGLEVRDVRRAIAQTLQASEAEAGRAQDREQSW